MAAVAVITSPAEVVTSTLAWPVPGAEPVIGTFHVAVPVASVVSGGETSGPNPWIVTVKVTAAFARGAPLNELACSVTFKVGCVDDRNLLGETERWAASRP
jgi:hypothetical protein